MTRRAFTLRREGEEGTALRQYTTGGLSPYDSALRSDFEYVDIPASFDETYLTSEATGYDAATMYFSPFDVNAAGLFTGTIDAYAIVRNSAGYPSTNLDGVRVTVLDYSGSNVPMYNSAGDRAYTVDRGLTAGKWYYYGLFARYQDSGNTYWRRVGVSSVLIPTPFGYRRRLWEIIPEYYRRLDSENVGVYAHAGVLQRFVEALGYEVDITRTYARTLGDLWDINNAPAAFLDNIGAQLGAPSESAAGQKRFRKLLANLMRLRKFSGTLDGIEGIVSATTGFPAKAYVGQNLFLSNTDAMPDLGNGTLNWTAWSNCSFTNTLFSSLSSPANSTGGGGIGLPGPAPEAGWVLKVTSSGASPTFGLGASGSFATGVALPVTAGHSYQFALTCSASTGTPTITMAIEWYKFDPTTASGVALISTTTDTAQLISTTRKRFGNATSLTAPANAAFCRPKVISSNTTGYVVYDSFDFHDLAWQPVGFPAAAVAGPSSAFESARKVFVNVYPNRSNFVKNSDCAVAYTGGWSTTNPTIYELLPAAYATYDDILRTPVTTKALTSNVATLTTSRPHKITVGQSVTVSGVDATFNGTYTVVSVPTATTFTYAKTAADVASTAATGYVSPGSEASYDDLLAGYDTFATTTTFSIDTTNRWMLLDSHGSFAPYLSQISSEFFPIPLRTPHSAKVQMRSNSGAGTSMVLRFKWFTAADPVAEIAGSSVSTGFTAASLTTWKDVVIANALPPVGALYGRLVIETTNPTTAHQELLRRFLIEDAAQPGEYFDGSFTDGAYQDYSFIGTTHQSFSVYMMQKNAMIAGTGGNDRLSTLVPTLMPPDARYAVNTPFSAVSLFS